MWILLRLRNVPGKAEIAELEIVGRVNQEVLWLDVSVDYVHLMAVIYCFEQLEDVSLDDVCLESSRSLLENLQERLVDEFKNQIELPFSVIKK
mgnify:CR=1 FL=1